MNTYYDWLNSGLCSFKIKRCRMNLIQIENIYKGNSFGDSSGG